MDNTTLPVGGGGDTIRTLDKTGSGAPKTEVVALDLGGGDGRSEFITGLPLPISLADVPTDDDGVPTFSFSPSTMDAVEMLFRQTIAAVTSGLDPLISEYADTGAVNALAVAGPNLVASLYTGLRVRVTAGNTNTGACTFNYNRVGSVSLQNADGSPINQGQIAKGSTYEFWYGGTAWQLASIGTQGPTIFETAALANVTNSYFSPLDPRRYGADANGVVDSTAAIQTAINVAAQNSNAGGVVTLIEGTFLITGTLYVGANSVAIQGSNKGATILFASSAFASDQPMLQYAGSTAAATYTITGITNAASAVATVNLAAGSNPFFVGQQIAFSGVVGMTQINGLSGIVTALGGSSGAWTATVNINSTSFTAYASGGTAAIGGRITNVFLRDLTFQSQTAGKARGITASWLIYSEFSNIVFSQLLNGFVGTNCFVNLWSNAGSFQIIQDNFRLGIACNNTHFDKCRMTGNNGVNVIGQVDTLKFTACDFEGIVGQAFTITNVTQATSAVATINSAAATNPVAIGDTVTFSAVNGMTQINGLSAVVSAIGGSSGAWTVTVPINSSAFTAYGSGGVLTDQNGAGIRLAPVTTTIVHGVAIDTCHFENIQGYAIACSGVDAGSVRSLSIKGCQITGGFTDYSNVGAISAILLENLYGFHIEPNHFEDWQTNMFVTNNTEIGGRIANNTSARVTQISSSGFRNQTLRENNFIGDRQIYFTSGNQISSPIASAQGDLVWASAPAAGGQAGYVSTATNTWLPFGILPGVSADNGDAGVTLTAGTSVPTQVWNTALTAARAVTLSTTAAYNGAKFRIIRTAAATGAFLLNVGTGPLRALLAGQWCDVEYDLPTTAWVESASGNLPNTGNVICLRATSIEQRTSTTTLTNSTQLTYAIPAAGTYAFEVVVFSYFTTAVTDGITANVNYSGTFTAVGSYLYGYLMNGTTTTTGIQPVEISATVNNALAGLTLSTYGASVAAATPAVHSLKGNLIATGAGTLAFAFSQSTNGVDTANLGVGSFMTVTQLS